MEGHRYVFRVSAANKIGQSEPTEFKGSVVTKDPWGKQLELSVFITLVIFEIY